MAQDSQVRAAQLDFLGGQDASKVPDRVPENAYFAGVNVSTKNGAITPRNGVTRQALIFPDETFELPNKYTRSLKDVFQTGKFQASAPFNNGVDQYCVAVIGGLIWVINVNTLQVSYIPIQDGERLDESRDRVNWSFADRYIVFFDYPARPIIFDGSSARRADPDDYEVPISVLGAYNQNRLFIANAGNEFTAGDPSGSSATPNAPITFEEILLAGSPYFGQIFKLPSGNSINPITGMTFLQQIDTSTGIGPLLVSNANSIYSYQTQLPRNQWTAGQFGALFIEDAGFAGPRAFTNVNSDLFFISSDGQLRAASMSRDEQNRWSRTPISREVRNWLKYSDLSLSRFSTITYFDNKIFITANPYRTNALTQQGVKTVDYAFGGYVVIELENVSTLTTRANPVWAGLWTGVRPMDFCSVGNRLFIFSKDGAGINQLYEFERDSYIDRAGTQVRYPQAIVYTREYDFEDPFMDKEPRNMEVALDDIQGKFELEVEFKPSQSASFLPWNTFTHEAPVETCKVPTTAEELNGLAAHSFKEIILGYPKAAIDNLCDPVTQIFYRRFRRMQLKIKLKGMYWMLHEFILKAEVMRQSDTTIKCDPYPVVKIPETCNEDWSYEEFGP